MRSALPLGPALLTALALATLSPSLARADLPAPEGFVDTCTAEQQATSGRECFACRASLDNSNHCSESLAGYGFASSCRGRGTTSWSEVWCRPADPAKKPVPQDTLAQLVNPSSHPPPMAAPPSDSPTAPLPNAAVAPTDPLPPAPTAPPPLPPKDGCGGCATPGQSANALGPLLALSALALAWSRRRARR